MVRYISELHKKDNTLDAVSVFRPSVVQFLKPAKLVFVWSYFINVSLHLWIKRTTIMLQQSKQY